MPRLRTGTVINREGVLYARISYRDESGRERRKEKKADNKTHANRLLKQMLRELDDHGSQIVDGERLTFAQLADHYEKIYLVEPKYVDGRKIAGMRSYRPYRSLLKPLKACFGKKKLRAITYSDLENYRAARLDTPARHSQRSIASVNRELSLLRKVLHVAMRNGWLIKSPFEMGQPIINPSDERHRERIITREEEQRLLDSCVGKRKHLKPIIICALDTGMRAGEILKLRWADVNLDNKLITVKAFNTKTMRQRQVGMTPRLAREILRIYQLSPTDPEALIFGIKDNVKHAFVAARKAAGLDDLRFHDLRHSAATRLVQGHVPISEVGRVLGHTQPATTYRYINADSGTAHRAAGVLAAFSDDEENQESPALVH